jgi:hypothetical protein
MFIACPSSTISSSVGAKCLASETFRSDGAKYFDDQISYTHLAPTELALSYIELTLNSHSFILPPSYLIIALHPSSFRLHLCFYPERPVVR